MPRMPTSAPRRSCSPTSPAAATTTSAAGCAPPSSTRRWPSAAARTACCPAGRAERVQVTGVNPADTEERVQRFERLRQGAQALGRLKPQEVRCLRLRAEGYSYQRDLRDHGLVVHEGQPLPDRGAAGVPGATGRDRVGRRVRAARPRPLGGGRWRGRRGRPGRAAPAPAPLPGLPGMAARVPRRARPRGGPGSRGGAGARRPVAAADAVRVHGRRAPGPRRGAG